MGKKNLRHEMRTQIMSAFAEGIDKHSMRKDGLGQRTVFSYGSRNQLLDRINDFVKTLPAEVKRLDQLRPEHVQAYLDGKAKTCTQGTVDEYRSELNKIGLICDIDLSVERVLADRKQDAARGAASVISREDFAKILEYAKENPSRSGVCIQLERELGVRVSDLAYGIKINGDTLLIRCKNGKMLTRVATPEVKSILASETAQKMIHGDKFIGTKDGSINKYLSRVEKKLGLEPHSFHDIRRRVAQDKYDDLRHAGVSRSDALKSVSLWLNHGEKRDWMLLRSYIHDAW